MDNLHLEGIIEDSLNDAQLPPEPAELEAATTDELEVPEAQVEPTTTDTEPTAELTEEVKVEEPISIEVASPAAKAKVEPQDDFEKKFGIPAQSSNGRENRIPYTRVKKIADRAALDAKTATLKEVETTHVPVAKFKELETKVATEFEPKLAQMKEFETVMMTDAPRFLDMLSKVPAYAKIFGDLLAAAEAGKTALATVQQVPVKVEEDLPDTMPEPDQELTDGSKVYSIEGLNARDAWNRAQARKEIMKEVDTKFGPLAKDYERYQTTQAILPKVEAQIADARTWPLFDDNEAEIVKVLQDYPKASLERAYQHVVWPKLQAQQDQLKKDLEAKSGEVKVNKETIRAEVLAELKRASKSTSVGASTNTKPVAAQAGPRTLEQVIAEQVEGFKAAK